MMEEWGMLPRETLMAEAGLRGRERMGVAVESDFFWRRTMSFSECES